MSAISRGWRGSRASVGNELDAWAKNRHRIPGRTREADGGVLELQKPVKPDPAGWIVRDCINAGAPPHIVVLLRTVDVPSQRLSMMRCHRTMPALRTMVRPVAKDACSGRVIDVAKAFFIGVGDEFEVFHTSRD